MLKPAGPAAVCGSQGRLELQSVLPHAEDVNEHPLLAHPTVPIFRSACGAGEGATLRNAAGAVAATMGTPVLVSMAQNIPSLGPVSSLDLGEAVVAAEGFITSVAAQAGARNRAASQESHSLISLRTTADIAPAELQCPSVWAQHEYGVRPQLHLPGPRTLPSTTDQTEAAPGAARVTRVTDVVMPGGNGNEVARQGEQFRSWSLKQGGDLATRGWGMGGADTAPPLHSRCESLPSAGLLSRLSRGAGASAGVGEGVWAGYEDGREQLTDVIGGKVDDEGAVGGGKMKLSASGGGGRRYVWLNPSLLGTSNARKLRPAPSRKSITNLVVPLDLAITGYGCSSGGEHRPVTILVKVPQSAQVLLAGCNTVGESPSDMGDTGDSGVTTAAGGLIAGCWPGVVLVAVHQFQSSFTWQRRSDGDGKYEAVLPHLCALLNPFIGWRLFAYEVVSQRRGEERRVLCGDRT
jgi:hypothetical protein